MLYYKYGRPCVLQPPPQRPPGPVPGTLLPHPSWQAPDSDAGDVHGRIPFVHACPKELVGLIAWQMAPATLCNARLTNKALALASEPKWRIERAMAAWRKARTPAARIDILQQLAGLLQPLMRERHLPLKPALNFLDMRARQWMLAAKCAKQNGTSHASVAQGIGEPARWDAIMPLVRLMARASLSNAAHLAAELLALDIGHDCPDRVAALDHFYGSLAQDQQAVFLGKLLDCHVRSPWEYDAVLLTGWLAESTQWVQASRIALAQNIIDLLGTGSINRQRLPWLITRFLALTHEVSSPGLLTRFSNNVLEWIDSRFFNPLQVALIEETAAKLLEVSCRLPGPLAGQFCSQANARFQLHLRPEQALFIGSVRMLQAESEHNAPDTR